MVSSDLMDRVTRSYLDEFREVQSLPGTMSEPDVFELFAIHSVVANAHDDEFDPADLHTGGGNDLGIDGIATIVNGVLVSSTEEAEDLLKINGFLDVRFIFIQAKSGSKFDSGELSTFLDGVVEFFSEEPTMPLNAAIGAARDVMAWLYSNSVKFTRQKPVVEAHYVTTGTWKGDDTIKAVAKKRIDDLESTGLFSKVSFCPYGADEIQATYQATKNSITVEFTFGNKVTLPEIEKVSVAYLGYLPIEEYLKLLTDSSGNIRKPLFYDNVRDFQGDNAVNSEIKQTLEDAAGRQRFSILNNGVTVVARDLSTTGNKFSMSDYQIVNGCQTSHVLFESQGHLGSETTVPVKIVHTTNEDIISDIITATNRQTEITTEDLFAKAAFQKKLEALYSAYPAKKKLYYERRSQQYANANGIEKVRIIDKKIQIRAFAAMFNGDAHRAARYYSDLRSQVETGRIFHDDHKLEPYYVSAFAHYKLEFLFRNSQIPVYYKPARYHILMAARYLAGGADMPTMGANRMTAYANRVAEKLWDDKQVVQLFNNAVEVIDTALDGQKLTRDTVKTQTFTDSVKKAALAKVEELAE